MICRRRAAFALALVFALPLALAHGDDQRETAFDPLTLRLDAYPTADGQLSEMPPDLARVAFAASSPPEPNGALDFVIEAPQAFFTQRGLVVQATFEAGAAPLAATDAEQNSVEVTFIRNGEPIQDASARRGFGPVLVPGERAQVTVPLAPPATLFAEGDTMGVRIRPLMPLPTSDALHLVLGAQMTTVTFEGLRVPTVRDLDLGDGAIHYRLGEESFRPSDADARIVAGVVEHERITLAAGTLTRGHPAYIVLVGEEPAHDAEHDHARFDKQARRDAAHAFDVAGVEILVMPGIGTAVTLPTDGGNVHVRCTRHCPAGGFAVELEVQAPKPKPEDQRSALIPPPADNSGVPSSDDAAGGTKDEKGVPGVGLGLATLTGAAVALARRRTAAQR